LTNEVKKVKKTGKFVSGSQNLVKKSKIPTFKKKLSTTLDIYEFTLPDIAQNLPCPSITIIDRKFRLVLCLDFFF